MGLLLYLWLKLYVNVIGAWRIVYDTFIDKHVTAKDLHRGEGRNVVITGGNRGIGFEAVKTLVNLGYNVIVGCRQPSKCLESLTSLKECGELTGGRFQCLSLDLTSIQSVREFAKIITDMDIPIHILINNAGIMMCPRRETQDGFESQFGVNYLSHFLLTSLLMPKIISAGDDARKARIVNVSSIAHLLGSWMDMEDLNWKNNFYSPDGAYGNSKAAQVMFTKHLQRQLDEKNLNVVVNCLHPGVVSTDLYKHAKYAKLFAGCFMKSADQGADTVLNAAASQGIEGKGGLYFDNSKAKESSSFTSDTGNQKKMWDKTLQLLKMEKFM